MFFQTGCGRMGKVISTTGHRNIYKFRYIYETVDGRRTQYHNIFEEHIPGRMFHYRDLRWHQHKGTQEEM